jgi:5-methylcytosine-specific restriction endonuclease McrA
MSKPRKCYHITASKKARVFAKTDGLCWYCGEPADNVDHFIPLNPPTELREYLKECGIFPGFPPSSTVNMIPACRTCNNFKGNKTVEHWRARIQNRIGGPFRFYGETALPPSPLDKVPTTAV